MFGFESSFSMLQNGTVPPAKQLAGMNAPANKDSGQMPYYVCVALVIS